MPRFKYPINLRSDTRGAIAVIVAGAALPVFGFSALAISHAGHVTLAAEANGWIEEACDRTNSEFFLAQDTASKVAAAEGVMSVRSADASGLPGDFAFAVTEVAGDVHIETSGTSLGLMGGLSHDVAFNVDCNGENSSPGGGYLIFAETFENSPIDPGWTWQVFSSYPNWSVEGYGPQIIVGGVDGIHPPSVEGTQYAELDSNWNKGGAGLDEDTSSTLPNPGQAKKLNSSIARTVYLEAGSYELTFSSRRKLMFSGVFDYALRVYVEPESTTEFSTTPLATFGDEAAWTPHTHYIDISSPR